jgi:CheY-like chemotaxis protein
MNMIKSTAALRDQGFVSAVAPTNQAIVLLVSDNPAVAEKLQPLCAFLELRSEMVTSGQDLLSILHEQQPIAVISDIDGEQQDGFHTMKVIADYHRDLPVFMLTDGDPILMGATDALQELCGLTSVVQSTGSPLAGDLVPFLFGAGRRAGCMRLVPI